ncbi:FdhE protein [Thermodesulfitimonas autotrophica]|uniref:FdhE protein n=1 Tax=Thermodesulfitimonas autotrophica TaxID=1894989 RepID=A0A3N5AD43_9THEO|nr:formate dehydrogenase accessory protein FdhE [Thermodesulfitimonas autotrophica]RPF42806.1 FdhE protein [Thermodesulfitimonas autotrophica]
MKRLDVADLAAQMVALWGALGSCGVTAPLFFKRSPTVQERQEWGKGIPWVMLLPPQIETDSFATVVACIAGAIKQVLPELEPEIAAVDRALTQDESLKAVLTDYLRERIIRKDGVVREVPLPSGLSPEAVGFVTGTAARLLMRAYAREAAAWFAAGEWRRGICPVCGNYPVFAVLQEEERARHLYCGLCGTSWRFERLACPFCGRQDGQGELLIWEEQPAYRVYLCHECRAYLKAFDAKWGKPEDLLVESFRTLFLDLLALREGYQNPALEWSNLLVEPHSLRSEG